MIQIDQIKLNISEDEDDLKSKVMSKLRISENDILSFSILRKSIDARKKPDLFYVYSVVVDLGKKEAIILSKNKKDNNIHIHQPKVYDIPKCKSSDKRPVVIGAGPAGLFAAYLLALNNLCPIIFERGKKVEQRTSDILKFWETGVLNTSSNVQFGEGGAGTFSDGKLNTMVNDKFGRNTFVLKTFVGFGAPDRILYDGKPHIGTDILKNVIANMRDKIIELGGEFHFKTTIDDFIFENNKLVAVMAGSVRYDCDSAVLAIGHSARDTFNVLYKKGVYMEAKDFAVGFRIEHPQTMISESMYGHRYTELEPAAYKLTSNLPNGKSVYSFCMCPGGFVVNSSSEENRLVVNGMSYSKRDSLNANSAIVVSVGSNEFDKQNPLAGIEYQRKIESKAFELGNGLIPQQLFGDYKNRQLTKDYGDFGSQTKGHTTFADLSDIFSEEIYHSVIDSMEYFGRKIKGYDRFDAILSGVESRTSSPVRISRNDLFVSNFDGLYPCGEGAGYAGGITSAAMDGLKVAEAIISKNREE